MELPEGHRDKIEFHERQFAHEVALAHGYDGAGPFTYNVDTGEVTFEFPIEETIVQEVYDIFVADSMWNRPDEKRFVELAEQETLTAEEEDEALTLQRQLVLKMLKGEG